MGHTTDRKNSLRTIFLANSVATPPTDAAYAALSPGYTTMELRRTFGSKSRAYSVGIIATKAINTLPVVAISLVNQSVNEGAVLTYAFNAGSFTDAQALTYTATLSSGAALPGWLGFTPGTRTFTGTAPAVTEATVLTVVVTATDVFGGSITDDFTVTINNV